MRVLIVDDDPNTLASLSRAFRLGGHEAVVADSADAALSLVRQSRFDIILSDVVMPGKDGLAMLAELAELNVAAPVIMISGQADIGMAVRATKLGAADFLEKPISTERLMVAIDNALRLVRLEEENRQLRQRVGRHDLIWASDSMRHLMAQVDRIGPSETRVCIFGETGTGKELVARAIHERSHRASRPFVTLNCAAVPAELIESELFGHEKGAFTGAAARHAGKFEQAHGGTLFLDEIGDMPGAMQAKLLRVLQEGEIERVGGDRPIAVDVRVLAATHRDLEALVRRGAFRDDLYHRVVVFPLVLPPLRERPDDIPVLVDHFAGLVAAQNGWRARAFTPGAVAELVRYRWPGNVRELRNVVERALLLADEEIDEAVVARLVQARPLHGRPESARGAATGATGTLAERLSVFERETVQAELARREYRVAETARALGLERSHLYKKCAQLGIDLKEGRARSAEEES